MLQPIQLLKKELARLRDIANVKEHNGIKAEENEVIPAYENSIQFLEEVNDVDASQHKALHKHIVNTRFSEDEEDEEDFEEEEPDFKICMCCGSVQQSGMSCKKCAGPLRDGFL